MLSDARFHPIGETPYAHEQEAVTFAREALPDRDPFQMWTLFELAEPNKGALYEVDLLILGFSALYLVEVKSGPGRYEGDGVDWWRIPPEGKPHYMEAPYRLANLKAKVLRGRLERHMKDRRRCPYVQALVFLSHENVQLELRADGRQHVITRRDFARAFTHHDFPGCPSGWRSERIDRPAARDIANALREMGIRPREGKAHAGSFVLGPVLAEGPGYQERSAVHRESGDKIRRRARIYLEPQQTSVERRQQLRRAADREAHLLEEVKEHPGVLSVNDYVVDAPLGPTVLFEPFEDGIPLGAFLKREPDCPFSDRVAIVEQVGRALAFCHRREIHHGGLSPEAVLVRRQAGRIEVRLCNFQLGGSDDVSATRHRSELASEPWKLYQAPELLQDPGQLGRLTDTFSFGALAYHVFTGEPPATTLQELLARLKREHWLEPAATSDDLSDKVAEWIRELTRLAPIERPDDVDLAVDVLLDDLTEPEDEPAAPMRDPLEARAGDTLGDLEVEGILGHGATSRVLQVGQGKRSLALKVPLSEEHRERFLREAEVLKKLRHPRVVELIDVPEIAGRTCLLMTLAGERTLQKHLGEEGILSIDLASRYGEDLLLALEHLEECQVMHRDIKPANLGVGSADKKRKHLTLFDFSLAFGKTSVIDVGTAVYRDPFLHERSGWDYHAERWSAAVTLHEMLTGVRPQWGDETRPALAEDARLRIAAERFEPALRDRLIAFFERALARDAAHRFASTHAMRTAWLDCFKAAVSSDQAPSSGRASELPPLVGTTDEQLGQIVPETPIAAVPLTAAARNALDRAGVLTMQGLLDLPDNRLNAVRGVGSRVAQEIVRFRARWLAVRDAAERKARDEAPRPFFPGYRGNDLMVHAAGLDEAVATALWDGGLRTLTAVAAAPKPQIEALVKRAGGSVRKLQAVLKAEHERSDRQAPESLEDWLAALLPEGRKPTRFFRSLYGLDERFEGRLDVTVKEVAEHHGVTQPAIYLAQSKYRTMWSERADFADVRRAVRDIVELARGAIPLARAAEVLRGQIGSIPVGSSSLRLAEAAAIVRICCEIDDDHGLQLTRLNDDAPWVLADPSLSSIVRKLGETADTLAARAVLATPGEVERELAAVVEGTPLAPLSVEHLSELAAAASKTAACSPRLEIYPRGMSATRALELCASVLSSGLKPLSVLIRVTSRYPLAERLPDRPKLDALLAPYGLHFNATSGCYQRVGDTATTSHSTSMSALTSAPTSIPTSRPRLSEREITVYDFEEGLRDTIERGAFRILSVDATRAEQAAIRLARAFELEVTSLDRLLIEEMRRQMDQLGVEEWAVHDADRAGPAGEAWGNLRHLMSASADAVAATLLPPTKPTLLVQPGLIGRYRLEGFLEKLVAASKHDEAAAIFLLLPIHTADRGLPTINGELAIPGVLPSQFLPIPRPWLRENRAA